MVKIQSQIMGNVSLEPIVDTKPFVDHRTSYSRVLRKNIGYFFEYLWELSASARRLRVDVLLAYGPEKSSSEDISTLYIGHGDNFAFLMNLIYRDFHLKRKFLKTSILNAKRYLSSVGTDTDLICLDFELLLSNYFGRKGYLQIPQWIRQKFIIPETWDQVLQQFRKNTKKTDLRKVRKYNFTYRITSEEDDYNYFYHHMYIPYLKKRFENEVIIEPKWKVLRQCRKGFLLQVLRDNAVVSTVLLHQSEGRLAYVWVGVPDNISDDMFQGAFSALYYFTILFGYNNGCHEIDFLGSRPLLNDGLFSYKRKWGTYVAASPVPRGYILIKPIRFTKPVVNFFAQNHFIARNNNGLTGKILHIDGMLNKDSLQKILLRCETPGINYLQVFSLDGVADEVYDNFELKNNRLAIFDLSESTEKGKINLIVK